MLESSFTPASSSNLLNLNFTEIKSSPEVILRQLDQIHNQTQVPLRGEYLARGLCLLVMSQLSKAILSFEKGLVEDPHNETLKALLNKSYLTYNYQLQHSKETVANLIELGVKQYTQRNLSNAEKFFLQALSVAPQNEAAIVNLGRLYYDMQRYEESLNYLQQAIEIAPNNTEAWIIVVLIAKQFNDRKTWQAAINHVKSLNPVHPQIQELDNW